MKKLLAWFLTLVLAATALAGCGSTSDNSTTETEAASGTNASVSGTVDKDAILTIASPQTCATLNPVNGYDYWYYLRYGIGETLMGFNDDMTPYCWLCDSYEMEDDQLTWKFTIRDNVTFSNGNQLTADIAKQCIEKAFAESNTAATYFTYDSITADGQVLTIKTTEPTPTLAYTLADPVFVMYDLTQDISNCAEEGVIGTGPFVVESFDSTTGYCSVVRNENYWNGEVQCAGINFEIITDTSAMGMSMLNKDVDAAYSIAYTDIEQFTDNDEFQVLNVASGRTDYCFLNENGVLADEVLRQAVSRALDKDTYCTTLLKGQFVKGSTPLTSALPYGYDEIEDINTFDVDSANQLLDDAGYKDIDGDGYRETPDGDPLTLNFVSYSSRGELTVMADAMQMNLTEIGINMSENITDQSSAWNIFTAGEYDMLAMSISMTSSGDPQTSMNSYFTTYNADTNANYNMFGYSNATVDELMEELKVEFDLTKRQDLIKQMETEIMNDSAIISLCYPVLNFVTTNQVSGITSHPSDYYWVSAETCKMSE